jgi:hypothetical protein
MATWAVKVGEGLDGVRIPAVAVATFEEDDGPWEYFRGRITSVTFGTTLP